jgi:Peptidase family C25/Propeptide_C25
MSKIIPVLVIGVLVLSGLGAAAFTTNLSVKTAMIVKNESTSVLFSSQPTQQEKNGFVTLEMNGATTQLLESNKPVLPIYVKTYEIPFGSTNIQVTCSPQSIGTMTLTKEVIPARIAPLSTLSENTPYVKDASVYGSAAFYPDSWYSYDLGAGRNANDQEVIFVKVVCYPVRYSPVNSLVTYVGFNINVNYDAPKTTPKTLDTSYDMVVIAPAAFQSSLQPLIDEKNTKGVKTIFKSVEDILAEYKGYDQPEQVKYFIKYAYDTWGITYVLLVGGLKSHIYAIDKDTISAGWKAWWVPVRYVSVSKEEGKGCLSDLYYGCLYNATGGFDSWDSNHDGVYAAWNISGAANDTFDMNPEVYVSRLPCTTVSEVKVVVNKILTYESTGPAAKPWYKTFIGIGGKTYAYWAGKPDGEYSCDLAYNYTKNAIPDLQLVRCYSSNRDTGGLTPIAKDIAKSITQGAGYVLFEGHGAAYAWNTIWFDGVYPNDWCGGLNVYLFPLINNHDKLPVVVVGGCHNALYNITFLGTWKEPKNYFCAIPCPVCYSWGLVVKPRGGAIASTGDTGYGLGSEDEGVVDPITLSSALEINFFWQIGNNSVTNLAKAHSQAITKYINEHAIHQLDAFCITNWALFGDPSLKLGGYSS